MFSMCWNSSSTFSTLAYVYPVYKLFHAVFMYLPGIARRRVFGCALLSRVPQCHMHKMFIRVFRLTGLCPVCVVPPLTVAARRMSAYISDTPYISLPYTGMPPQAPRLLLAFPQVKIYEPTRRKHRREQVKHKKNRQKKRRLKHN